jgi:DNA-binding GntR family transcriptional regulator
MITSSAEAGGRGKRGIVMAGLKTGRGGTSLVETATNKIRDRILDLTLAPGSQLDEAVLRDKLNISRTPAREALSRLVTEGLVENNAARGFFVRQIDLRETAHFFNVYILVERAAAGLCRFSNRQFVEDMRAIQKEHAAAVIDNRFLDITRFNAAFHTRIASATENRFFYDFSVRTHNFARRLAFFVYAYESDDRSYFEGQQDNIVSEHDSIIDSIEARDRDALVDLVTSHAERLRRRIANFVQGKPVSELASISNSARAPGAKFSARPTGPEEDA